MIHIMYVCDIIFVFNVLYTSLIHVEQKPLQCRATTMFYDDQNNFMGTTQVSSGREVGVEGLEQERVRGGARRVQHPGA